MATNFFLTSRRLKRTIGAEAKMNNISNIPWYLVLGGLFTLGIMLMWAAEMIWDGLTGRRRK